MGGGKREESSVIRSETDAQRGSIFRSNSNKARMCYKNQRTFNFLSNL